MYKFIQVYEFNPNQMYIEEKPLVVDHTFTNESDSKNFLDSLGGEAESIIYRKDLEDINSLSKGLVQEFINYILENSDSDQFQIIFA